MLQQRDFCVLCLFAKPLSSLTQDRDLSDLEWFPAQTH